MNLVLSKEHFNGAVRSVAKIFITVAGAIVKSQTASYDSSLSYNNGKNVFSTRLLTSKRAFERLKFEHWKDNQLDIHLQSHHVNLVTYTAVRVQPGEVPFRCSLLIVDTWSKFPGGYNVSPSTVT